MSNTDYKTAVLNAVSNAKPFLKLTLSHPRAGTAWRKIAVRPVVIKGMPHLQIARFSQAQALAENVPMSAAPAALNEVLALPFAQIHVQTSREDLHIRITKKGRALFKRAKPSRPNDQPALSHNRVKHHPLPDNRPDAFLQGLGIMDAKGRVRAYRRDKFKQINAFLAHLHPVIPKSNRPLTLIDCGCGSAYLTFAAYHYLNHIQHIPTRLIGIDHNPALIAKCRALAHSLGWTDIAFCNSSIADFTPRARPDMVFSLHACDTATDDAIARAVQWRSAVILAAPCCQRELREQLSAAVFAPVIAHGILKNRTADILTDACRAQLLRIVGYRAEVMEFIDSKHTPKNLLIRATKTSRTGDQTAVQAYRALRDFWHINPSLERLLARELAPYYLQKTA